MVNVWKIILAALITIAALKMAFFDINKNNYYWDEAVYLDIAKNVQEGNGYTSSNGENFRAPLFPVLLSLFSNTTLAHLFVMLLTLTSILLMFMLGKEVLNKKAGLIAALILATNSLYNFWSYKLVTEPLALCLILASLYFFIRYEKQNNNKYLYLSFFAAGTATLARYTGLSLIAALTAALILKERKFKKEHAISVLVLILSLAPIFALGVQHYGNPLGMLLQNSAETAYPKMPISDYTKGISYSFGYIAPLLFLFAFIGNHRKKVPTILLLYLLATIALLISVSQKYQRFLIILLPAYAIISAVGFMNIYEKSGKYKHTLVIAMILFSALMTYQNIQDVKLEKHNTEILLDAANFVKNSDCEAVFTNSTKHFSYFSEKKTLDYPSTEQDFVTIEKEAKAPCIVIDSFHGMPGYRKFINDTYKLIYTNSSNNKFVYVYST